MSSALQALVGIIPVIVMVPAITQIAQSLSSGQPLDIGTLFQQLLPPILVAAIVPSLFSAFTGA
jgi:hypothetical protein